MSENLKRSRKTAPMILPDDLYDYLAEKPSHRRGKRHPGESIAGIGQLAVVDDWPNDIPVTKAEVDVFERYFGDVLDALLGISPP
jgi:hypothetical protein